MATSIQYTSASLFTSIQGPLITANFPDPCILYHQGTTYAFATNNRRWPKHINVQVATSTNNDTWTVQELDALPKVASWQTGLAVWAPDVKHLPMDRFLLYYTDSLVDDPATHCIGAAMAGNITGPYRPLSDPLICPWGGAIDPSGFYDHNTGKRYIVYKVDGNSLGRGGSCNNDVMPIQSTPLMLQEVDCSDGVTLIDEPVQILNRDALDGPLIEAPTMYLSSEGIYFLFYSSNCFTTSQYHTNYATATNISGPYVKATRPLFITGDYPGLTGPGGMDIIHHAYTAAGTEDFFSVQKHKKKHDVEGRMIVFHGHMTPRNDPSMNMERESGMHDRVQKPIADLHLDFIRGMYSGIAYFNGRGVLLHEHPTQSIAGQRD